MTPEKEQELRQKLRDTFQEVSSNSTRHGYSTHQVIDPETLFELLEDIIEVMRED